MDTKLGLVPVLPLPATTAAVRWYLMRTKPSSFSHAVALLIDGLLFQR
ncbi:hypothetical protein [Achromobacter sp.]|nr:hypothetical protein [Achromobacter sp.]